MSEYINRPVGASTNMMARHLKRGQGNLINISRPACLILVTVSAIIFGRLELNGFSSVANGEQFKLEKILPKVQAIHDETKLLLSKNTELKVIIEAGLQSASLIPDTNVQGPVAMVKESSLDKLAMNDSTAAKTNQSQDQHLGVAEMGLASPKTLSYASNQTEGVAFKRQQSQDKKSMPNSKASSSIQVPDAYSTSNKPLKTTTTTITSKETLKTNVRPKKIDYAELDEFNHWVEKNLEYAVQNTHATAEALKEEAQLNNGNVDYTEQAIDDGIEGVKYWKQAISFQDKTLRNEHFEIE